MELILGFLQFIESKMSTKSNEQKPKQAIIKDQLSQKQKKEKKLQEALRQNLLRRKASDDK